jgi:acetyl-CoA carboxylase carboxyltransferase component
VASYLTSEHHTPPGRYIDDIIDPAETRLVLCKELEVLRNKNVENPPRKHSNVPL